jgi:hypothetical protein
MGRDVMNDMNYDDSIDMIHSVLRDIAVWDMKREGYDPVDEGMIDDWIHEFSLIATKSDFIKICKQYWNILSHNLPYIEDTETCMVICIGVCTLNEHLICYGCGRTNKEIEDSGDIRSLPIVIRKRTNENA